MAVVILNVAAAGGRTARLEAPLREALKRHHPGVALHATLSVSEARRAVADAPRGERVVVVGGDGTLHQLLPALLDGAHTLALIPAGSGDDSARALGLHGLRWARAMSRALTGEALAMDIGWARTEHEERPFFSSLAAGFDAAVAQRAAASPGWLRGLPRYLLATLREVTALRAFDLRVALDDQPLHDGAALFASAFNTASYGAGMPAMPKARIDDGRLDLLLAGRFGRLATLAMLPRLLLGAHLGHPRVRHAPFEKLHIESTTPLPLAADGEAMADAQRITVRIGRGVLRVVPGTAFVPTDQGARRASSSRTSRTTSLSSVSTE